MGKKLIEKARIVENAAVYHGTYILKVKAPQIIAQALPGQFVMVEINPLHDPLLNRPLGIAAVDEADGILTMVYRVVGRGTSLLTDKRPGEDLNIIGPLGNGFNMNAKRPLLIGGGMGLAPLLYVAQKFSPTPVEVIAGGRTKDEMFWADLFASVCDQVHVSTDDGTLGTPGTCVALLSPVSAGKNFDAILACGPEPMLKAVAQCAQELNIPCQVSLEKHMACGFGACLTCTCESTDGRHLQVCKQGPVFNADEVKL